MKKRFIRREKENAPEAKSCQVCIFDKEAATADTWDISVLEGKDTEDNICNVLNGQISGVHYRLTKNFDIFSNKPD